MFSFVVFAAATAGLAAVAAALLAVALHRLRFLGLFLLIWRAVVVLFALPTNPALHEVSVDGCAGARW